MLFTVISCAAKKNILNTLEQYTSINYSRAGPELAASITCREKYLAVFYVLSSISVGVVLALHSFEINKVPFACWSRINRPPAFVKFKALCTE